MKYNVSEEFSLAHASNHAALGFEYQVLDDSLSDDNKIPSHLAGSLYDLIPTNGAKQLVPVGQWNTSRIVFHGNHGEQWLNGAKVVEFDLGTPRMDSLLAKSKYRTIPGFADRRSGHIVLQDHNDETYFRDIKIRELNAMTPDDNDVDRREFLKTASVAGLGLVMTVTRADCCATCSPNDHVSVAVFGLNGRGMVHAQNFSRARELVGRVHVRRRFERAGEGERRNEVGGAAAESDRRLPPRPRRSDRRRRLDRDAGPLARADGDSRA